MIKDLREKIIKANDAYRLGNPIISDYEYDKLVDELSFLSPDDELLTKVGHSISDDSRKSKLPIPMFSMNKIKLIKDIHDWFRLKEINRDEDIIITPKFDGLSLCVKENTEDAWTRGDGVIGQSSNNHYFFIQNHLHLKNNHFIYTYGEVMMPKQVFLEKYSNDFANPRNLVAGLLNSKEPSDSLKDCQYIKYGAISNKDLKTKKELLDELNLGQDVKVQYYICKLSDLNEDFLFKLFQEYSKEYEIDGLILEINNLELQEKLGRETSSNNPCWARAYKSPLFEQRAETEVIGISWNISKNGSIKPVAIVNPINLGGVVVSRCTLNNARFVKDNGLGVGSRVVIVRSGLVIPKVVEVLKKVDFVMPVIDGVEIGWNENYVELITLNETDNQKLKKITSFFEILGADNVSSGVITQLWDAGYKTIKDILNLTKDDLKSIDRFGDRKSEIVFNSIQNSVKDVELCKLQHATGIFNNMGSKKLKLLEEFKEKPSVDDVLKIEGIGDILANEYVNNYDDFFNFISGLPITIKENVKVESGGLEGMVFCFTGIRMKAEEDVLINKGAKVSSSVSKNTTHVVCRDKNSTSSKIVKAREFGITIMDVDEFLNFIK